MGVSGNLWILVKDVKTLVVYDVESETAMDSMNVTHPEHEALKGLGT